MKNWEKNVRLVTPYTPGEQPKKRDIIKLNTNENPYSPAPGVQKVLKEFETDRLRLYPDPASSELVDAIASEYGVRYSQVFAGVGSDDVLAMAFMTFFNSKKPILFPDITYSFYDVWAEVFRIPYETIPLDEDFRICTKDYQRENGGVIFPNPNAPTGVLMPLEQVEEIIRANQDVVVIVDEAYIGSEKLIAYLNDVKYSFNSYTMDQLTLAMGKASVEDREYFKQTTDKIIRTREWTKEELKKLGFLFEDSKSNFVFVTHPNVSAKQLFENLKKENVYVRYFAKPERISNYLRITIGTDEEMQKLISLLKKYC